METKLSPRKGMSLVEILVAVGMLAGVLVPIGWMLTSSAEQTARSKAEAAAAGYAEKIMNIFLEEVSFDDLTDGTHTSESPPTGFPGGETIDGTEVRWTLEVTSHDSDDFFPAHWRITRPIPPSCPTAPPPYLTLPPADPDTFRVEVNAGTSRDRHAAFLDSKTGRDASGSPQALLKDLRVTIQWKSPRDDDFEAFTGDQEKDLKRSVRILTRRGRLGRTI